MSQALPFLPGYNQEVKSKTNFNKSHLFDFQNGIRVDTNKATEIVDMRSFPVNALANFEQTINQNAQAATSVLPNDFADTVGAKYTSSNAQLNNVSSLPAWVAYDRKVLRFYAYFKEAVFSSPVEDRRIRKCVVYYYLEDDSVHVAEPKVENSGIPQGVFIKRHRIPKANQEFVNLNDLVIGNNLSLYGRNFHLYACDGFTRAFFEETGGQQPEAEVVPADAFSKKHTTEVGTFKKLMHPMKEFMEAALGKQMGLNIQSTQKFLKNDGNVLRFYCVWHDGKILGESRPFVLHYFLADDTLEVMEVKQANSGRDPFQAMLKRAKLPKNYTECAPDLTRIGSSVGPQTEYYTDRDLRVNTTVQVYGRALLIKGCDDFTKRYYMDQYGWTEKDFPEIVDENTMPIGSTRMEPPPHNGFGTEEDSLGSFLYLTPKVPKADMKKLMENDGLILRYLGKLVDSAPEDKKRRFIITYFMSNDTISIFERFERNSGFIGGKFAERRRCKDPVTNDFYSTKDMAVGTQIILSNFKFEILEADAFTDKFMKMNPTHFTLLEAEKTF